MYKQKTNKSSQKGNFKYLHDDAAVSFSIFQFFIILSKIKKTFSVLIKRFPIKKSSIMEQKCSTAEH